jgi:hypothetical protein
MKQKASLLRQIIFYFPIAFTLLFSAFGTIILHYNTESFREQSYDYCRQIVQSHILNTDKDPSWISVDLGDANAINGSG